MTESLLSDQKAAEILERSGGEKLQECLACNKCDNTCFIESAYPGITPRNITLSILNKDTAKIQELVDTEFLWACTLCGRCMVECPKNIKLDSIIRIIRGLALIQGKVPKRLEEGLNKIKEIGNSVGIDTEEFVDSLQWLGEEAAPDLGLDEDEFTVPIDKEGADFLYIPNPREYTSAPNMFSVYLKFFTTVNADWTYASNLCDISNWAYYLGDDETNMELVRRTVETARKLGVKAIITTECGHGFKIIRHDAEEMIGEPLGFEVLSIVELAYQYWKEGKLKLRKGAIEGKVTYHDPCNVGRKLGVYEAPRELLKYICEEYVDMEPHSEYAVCCGGGGSVAQNTEMGQKRLAFGKAKSDQITATEATLVTTSCQMCLAQLVDIQAHYKLPVTNRTVIELVMDSLEE